jgi:hypothetical protein
VKVCAVCWRERRLVARGLCDGCRKKLTRLGCLHSFPKVKTPTPAWTRLHGKFEIVPNGCWNWSACKMSEGYGAINLGNDEIGYAHRVMWEMWNGDAIPEGMEVDHLCFNKGCVNPDHLEVVTPSVNSQRACDAGRRRR